MTDPAQRPLDDVQDEILDRLHAGEAIDREAVLAANPAHADALRQFFAVLDVIESPPPPSAPAAARLGEFRIVREIGRGGMGIVYEAEQTSLGRRVALKVLPPALQVDGRVLARFRREAEAAGRLRHPNVVPVYVFGEAAGTPFLAMELVEGLSLAQTITERRAALERGEHASAEASASHRRFAADVITRVADALDYAHGRGILHRDVKPGNILVEKDGTPRLTDFGLALDLDAASLTMAGEVFGSPLYMSPEQAFRREAPVDARSDVYSLAVTFYELLTLRLPYDGVTQAEVLTALGTGSIVPPRRWDPAISEPLEQVILRALRKDPRDRHATAAAFAADIRAAMEGRPVEFAPLPATPAAATAVPAMAVAAAVAPLPIPVPPPIPQSAPASFSAMPPPVPPPLASPAPVSPRRVWPWIAGGCLLLLVVPCLLASFFALSGSSSSTGGPSGGSPPPVPWDTLPALPDLQSGPAIPESQRAAMIEGLIRTANDSLSSNAREMIVQTVPRIPGGITAAELAEAIDDMFGGDQCATIVAIAPYIRPGMTSDDIESLTEGLWSTDKPRVMLALASAGSALNQRGVPLPEAPAAPPELDEGPQVPDDTIIEETPK